MRNRRISSLWRSISTEPGDSGVAGLQLAREVRHNMGRCIRIGNAGVHPA